MRGREDHYAEADRLLEEVKDQSCVWADGSRELILMAAIAHALLATAPSEVAEKVRKAESAQHNRAMS